MSIVIFSGFELANLYKKLCQNEKNDKTGKRTRLQQSNKLVYKKQIDHLWDGMVQRAGRDGRIDYNPNNMATWAIQELINVNKEEKCTTDEKECARLFQSLYYTLKSKAVMYNRAQGTNTMRPKNSK